MTRRLLLLVVAALAGCAGLPLPHEGTHHGSDADLSVTRIVHGSLVLEMGKTRLLVDPWFNSAVATRQTEALGMLPDKLPPADAVLLTHKHAGHYDPDALSSSPSRCSPDARACRSREKARITARTPTCPSRASSTARSCSSSARVGSWSTRGSTRPSRRARPRRSG
jgi:hypothetical protein